MDVVSPAGCSKPELSDAVYNGDTVGFVSGTAVKVSCKEKYTEAYPSITCHDGHWSDTQPPCKRKCHVHY